MLSSSILIYLIMVFVDKLDIDQWMIYCALNVSLFVWDQLEIIWSIVDWMGILDLMIYTTRNCVHGDHTTLQLEFKNHHKTTMLQLLFQ
jgi:hypothetical protein